MTEVYLGDHHYRFPSDDLSELCDHTPLYNEGRWADLRTEMHSLGYLRVRGLNQREHVLSARRGGSIKHFLQETLFIASTKQRNVLRNYAT